MTENIISLDGNPELSTQFVRIINHSSNPLPEYKTDGAAGMDVCSNEEVEIEPGKTVGVRTGLYVALPYGWEFQVRPRSGLALKNQITVLNSPGTIDSDYRGEIVVILTNFGDKTFKVEVGDRIAQLVLSRVVRVVFKEVLKFDDNTKRGDGGFGSTGK
jgi:dUTP pyrophosphatase